jgi:hypothetical protein
MREEEFIRWDNLRSPWSRRWCPPRPTWFKSQISQTAPISLALVGENLHNSIEWKLRRSGISTSTMLLTSSISSTSPVRSQNQALVKNEYGDPRDRDCLVVHYPQGKPSLGQHVQGQPREQPLEQTLVM